MHIDDEKKSELLKAIANQPINKKAVRYSQAQRGVSRKGSGIKKHVQIFDEGKNFVAQYENLTDASEAMNTPHHRIQVAACHNKSFRDMDGMTWYATYIIAENQKRKDD